MQMLKKFLKNWRLPVYALQNTKVCASFKEPIHPCIQTVSSGGTRDFQ